MMNRTAKRSESCPIETLEERQLFSAMGTINVTDMGTHPGVVVTYTFNGAKDYAEAGVYNWTRSATNPGTYAGTPTPGQTFGAFCVEIDQDLPSGPNIGYTVTDLAAQGAAKADQLKELWGRFHASIGTDNTKAAAFQSAVWEIVSDTGKNVTSGAFRLDTASASGAAVANQAQSWLNQLNGCGPKANLLEMSSPTDQDQLFEVPPCTPTTKLRKGMTATIGFWQNKNGQALLKSLNGGATATKLGNWLATNFPNLCGTSAGANNLAGKTNTQVAAFFVAKFGLKGPKLDAQMMSVAFATYVTNSALAGGMVAAKYGFIVNMLGTANATIGVGSGGAAFGVANNSTLTVWQVLKAADQLSAGGSGASRFDAFNGNTSLRNLANTVFTAINEGGDI